ncbi:MAG: ATP-binding protein [Bacteroidota bacterium]|nr:ATP-binding protein [Bacteroidota bacterium]MDP4192804.1 ATP-binding protein [Bacteroidota bacterium]
MKLSLRKRISFLYMIATAVLTGLLFLAIYVVVFNTVYHHLNSDLDAETLETFNNIVVFNDRFAIVNSDEWIEKEHKQIEVNPTFVQIVDKNGKLIKRTGNLLETTLRFLPERKTKIYFNSQLSGKTIRQIQYPVTNPSGTILGYIIIAIPLEESALVLSNLRNILLGAFPIVLLLLYFVTNLIAGKSISPINKVIATANKITNENLDKRVELPVHEDEIYLLASTINELLDRLESSVLREKQFTSDASHELRTPLAIIKGTLEVLVRKPRSIEQYTSKIKYCIGEVDRMSSLVDQLLMLARFESGKLKAVNCKINLVQALQGSLSRLQQLIEEKGILVNFIVKDELTVLADINMLNIIFDNIFSNAIKYSYQNGKLDIIIESSNYLSTCTIKDYGIGIEKDQLSRIFDRFYRADESRNSQISGNGLGLAIVKKLSDLQNIKLEIISEPEKGTDFIIKFHSYSPENL